MTQGIAVLGGMSAEQFLAEYWQKKPLLIRGALRDVGAPVDLPQLIQLAQRDDVESRLIELHEGRWRVERGPLRAARFKKLPPQDWTVLVQGVNLHVPHIDHLLWQFGFLPYARLDDLMISYAPPGGTVGPHIDSYDVFLLQVGGSKSWQISGQRDARFVADAPLRILQNFHAEQSFVLESGDLLYLPPKYAHYGVALAPGMTYSIGFRAPQAQELATQFLVYLQDTITLPGQYADPDLQASAHPAKIAPDMVAQVSAILAQIRWDEGTVADFLGRYLTEPKAHVFFDAPDNAMALDAFIAKLAQHALVLDAKSQMLFVEKACYCNGDELMTDAHDLPVWCAFADARRLMARAACPSMYDELYSGYSAGYWHWSM